MALSDIKGLGPARVKKLKKAGITSVEAFAGADKRTLADKTGIPEKTLAKLIKNAQDAVEERYGTPDEPVLAGDVLETLADLHQRIATLEMRMQAVEARMTRPLPAHITRLSEYIQEHLSDWTDENIYSFLEDHGHPAHDIASALQHARNDQ